MSALDLEAEYNNRARVANSGEIIARWAEASAKARADLECEPDIAYGPRFRNRYDLYPAAGDKARAPLVVYIHGGYWQRGDRREYAFVARELVARGVNVALPSYTLCPEAGIGDIVAEMQQFLAQLWERTKCRPVIVGHSAGGHLAAMLMASRKPIGEAPADLVRAAYGLSGVYDLPPLIPTSLNEALELDDTSAWSLSPMFGPKPARACEFVAAVGGDESPEFIRQATDFTRAWARANVAIESNIVAGKNHFTIVDEFCRPGSAMLDRVIVMAEAIAT
jgi:arylformamidase